MCKLAGWGSLVPDVRASFIAVVRGGILTG